MDGRKQPICGLWIHASRYYVRLIVENPLHVNRFVESRLKENVSTINLDVIVLRVVFKHACPWTDPAVANGRIATAQDQHQETLIVHGG